ncbi:hypothetical protein CN918_29955 [Priestia megaterium]|nr:hypothetical protein CN918_29955 [Priestia megaterium]
MGKLAVVTLPDNVLPFEQQWFTEEEAQYHRVWKLNEGPYYIITADKPSRLFSKTQPYRMTNEEMLQVAKKLIHYDMLSEVVFMDEVEVSEGYVSQEWEKELALLNSLRDSSWKRNRHELDKDKIMDALSSLIHGAEQEIDYLEINVNHIPHARIGMRTTGTFSYLNTGFLKEEQATEVIETAMSAVLESPQASPIHLRVSKKVPHPLKYQHSAFTHMLSKSGNEVQQELGLSDKEWTLIMKDLENYILQDEKNEIHEHKAKTIRETILRGER